MQRCIIKKTCSNVPEPNGEIQMIKFMKLYRGMQNYWCSACKQNFAVPVGTLTKKEFNNLKDE